MPHPSTYRPAPGTVPDSPGVYRFRDARGTVVYVGKAKSLRSRVGSYFQDLGALHPRTRQMVTTAASVEWTVVGTEVEALQLEYSWIKQYDPRFNVRYRDDKSYPSLAVTLDEEYPRLQVMRGPKRRGVRYFGPYAHAWAIRETLDLLLRVFPARTCSRGVFVRAGQVGRPCLLGYIGKCSAPCVGRVSAEEHRRIVDDFCDFMAGKTDVMVKRLQREMAEAAAALEYERAARIRDDLGALQRAVEKQTVVLTGEANADVVAVAEDELEAAVQVFHVRGGRVRGQRGFVVDKVEALDTAGLVAQFIEQVYGAPEDEALAGGFGAPEEPGDGSGSGTAGGPAPARRKGARTRAGGRVETTVVDDVPREVLVPVLPPDVEALTTWLVQRRGGSVTIRVPQRGDKRQLMETVERNAKQALLQHKLKRSTDLTARSRALGEIQEALGLAEAPLRIECFDVSHVQGTNVVASMVVFEDGLARRSEYRRFAVRGTRVAEGNAQDDTAAIAEVISRRFARHVAERLEDGENVEAGPDDAAGGPLDPATGRPRRFAYPPNLVVVDGGAPQVAAAARALAELGVDDVALCGLAKRLEEVWLPGEDDPVVLPRSSEGLYLLQRVRDEAHRFAIAYHRQKRSSAMTVSALDGIAGLGETRRKALLKHFGSVKRLRAATAEEIATVPGIGRRTAEAVVAALGGTPAPAPAVDPTTGEIIEDVSA